MAIIHLDIHNNKYERREDDKVSWRISAYACIFDEAGKLLMTKTEYNDYLGLPGGGIEAEETIEAGIKRECQDELSCNIQLDPVPFYVSETNFFSENTKFRHSVNIFYRAKLITEVTELDPNNEIIGYGWYDVSDLDNTKVFNNLYDLLRHLKR